MSNKYEVIDVSNVYLGTITKYRAEKAIFYGIAHRVGDISINAIRADCRHMRDFEEFYKQAQKENTQVKVNCWKCGKAIQTNSKTKIPYCEECSNLLREENIKEVEIYSKLRTKFMFERALKILEKQQKMVHIWKYEEAAKVLQEYTQENYTKFDSSHEMVVAIELLRNKVHIKIQPTIAGRQADFILKEEKVILEIDGFLHEHTQEKDYNFDNEVREELGPEWEVIRIPTKYIERNITMIYEAIMELKIYKQKLRQQNNGVIPDYYSSREKAAFEKMLK